MDNARRGRVVGAHQSIFDLVTAKHPAAEVLVSDTCAIEIS